MTDTTVEIRDMIDIRAVGRKIGGKDRPVHPSTIRRMVRDGKLPRPIKFGQRVARWRASEIDAHIEEKLAERDKPTTAD